LAQAFFFRFKNEDIYWFDLGEVYAFDGKYQDGFGYKVFIDYPYLLVGAPFNSKDIHGGNELMSSGSSYLSQICHYKTLIFNNKITNFSNGSY
jgi:hypothetical protein